MNVRRMDRRGMDRKGGRGERRGGREGQGSNKEYVSIWYSFLPLNIALHHSQPTSS